jgi:DNA polymerase I
MSESKSPRVVLVDGSGYIFRAFFALPPMTRGDGTPVNAVFGFSSMLFKLMQDHRDDDMIVVFDAGRLSFRNEIYDKYKANRDEPPPELVPQFQLVRDAARAFGLPAVEVPGFEADDLIATYVDRARELGREVVIVSSDKDLMQLVADGVCMWDPMKGKVIGPAEVEERFGVGPELVQDCLALGRRQLGQRAGRARDRGEDGGAAAAGVRLARGAARRGRHHQAAEAAAVPDRLRRPGAAVEGAGGAPP